MYLFNILYKKLIIVDLLFSFKIEIDIKVILLLKIDFLKNVIIVDYCDMCVNGNY